MTITDIASLVQTEAAAYEFFESLRWPDGAICPHCESPGATFIHAANGVSRKTRTGAMSERRVWQCCACRKQFSVITGTVFQGTKIALRKWALVFFEMVSSKNGVAAREIQRKYGITCKSAWFMLHRIREAMKSDPIVAKMTNTTIQADESFIGGSFANMHASRRLALLPFTPGQERGAGIEKTPVFTLIDANTGEARSAVVPNVTGATLKAAILANVDPSGSALYTDGLKSYVDIGTRFAKHASVNHEAGEYVRGEVTTNKVENFFSQLQRSLDGTHHHVSREHLPRYLAEFDFRYSTRKESDTERFARLMGQVGGRRLTYKRISSH